MPTLAVSFERHFICCKKFFKLEFSVISFNFSLVDLNSSWRTIPVTPLNGEIFILNKYCRKKRDN